MYPKDEGHTELARFVEKYRAGLKTISIAKALHLDIPVVTPGILPPTEEDIVVLNSEIPFFNIQETQERSLTLRWYVFKPISYIETTESMARDAHCVELAIQFGTSFLMALSMATLSFAAWRSINFSNTYFNGFSITSNRGSSFSTEPVPLTVVNPTLHRMHAGHIAAALQIQNEIMNWHEKFILCYEKAQLLLSAPSHLKINFCDEAYLNYFRCLEYLVMDRVLEQKGNYSNHRLADAFQKYKIPVQQEINRRQFLDLANRLDRQRDSAVAHLTRSNLTAPGTTGQQVYELKTLIDILVFKHANFRLYGLPEQGGVPVHLSFNSST